MSSIIIEHHGDEDDEEVPYQKANLKREFQMAHW